MKAIILSAGIGSRLNPYTTDIPKCLVKVDGLEILAWQLKALSNFDIEETIVVIGYKAELVKKTVKGYNVTFIENKNYATTSNLHSLKIALVDVDDEILIINGDLVFERPILTAILSSYCDNAVAVVKKSCDEEDMKVIITPATDSYNARRIIEISKDIPIQIAKGQALGIYKIRDIDVLKEQLEVIEESNFFNEAINRMTGIAPVYAVDITQFPSIEIDFPEDLKEANRLFKNKEK